MVLGRLALLEFSDCKVLPAISCRVAQAPLAGVFILVYLESWTGPWVIRPSTASQLQCGHMHPPPGGHFLPLLGGVRPLGSSEAQMSVANGQGLCSREKRGLEEAMPGGQVSRAAVGDSHLYSSPLCPSHLSCSCGDLGAL